KSEQLEDAPIVKKGDRLTLYVESEVFKITTPGEALESGALGDIIKVSNLSSNKKIYGFVRSSQAVEVKY
ncbi:MAG: flagellar basal body P-ring formation protein FlgA, partial [Deltaproteobacteria bacterium]|nr:flagellar basal body P-ring formation protein FlgA [Deltaproteobacteria bacterium]